ncbi:hypothetical protein ACM39_07340 [Chryseobacterium sp. FH2]|uniref:hypothetical protein n=1 Tax=Chryseobacterium sp. FH2 TaxID=1674291 RepID=UPI00065B0311|nr:hypothetical protein [Chryseobacterium sp. FH2]KMQ68329.1 hypothetical protein ACM39_07340 [Chryseobacterium sp. FH2]
MGEFTIVKGLFDNRKRQLIIDENFIKFENKDKKDDLFTIINKDEIIGFRYGTHFIRGYRFIIGREYQIFIRNKSGKELKINFSLFYKRKLNEKHQLFCDLVNELWKQYFDEILENYFQKFKNNVPFELSGVKVLHDRIQFSNKKILLEDLDTKAYYQYLMIFSKQDKYNNKMLYYLKDKDAVILSDLLTKIKNEYSRK